MKDNKFNGLSLILAPPLWGYSAGFAFGSLATVLGSEHPDLVTAAFRAVGFVLSFPVVGLLASLDKPVAPDWERRDWQAARERVVSEERVATEYASELRVSHNALSVNVGKHTFHFPDGITPSHLMDLTEVVIRNEPPTDRNLSPRFESGKGKTYQTFRDWMVYHAGEKPGTLAQFRTGRRDWDLTPLGVAMLYQWMIRIFPPTMNMDSSSPTQEAIEVKKVLISLCKAMRERTKQSALS